MAESLISDLCKAVGSKVLEEGHLLLGVPEEAEKLTTKLKRIKAVQKAAEQRELEDDVKEWKCELKNLAYGIEDVLDDWSIAQQQMNDQFGTTSQHGNTNKPKANDQVCFPCIPTPSFCLKQTKSLHEIAITMKNFNSKLEEFSENTKKFKFPESNTTSINEVPRLSNDCEPQCVLTEIEGRKFLIVLGDVWQDSEGKWGAILKCLAKGDTQGSRILMTTRNSEFSQKMGAVFALPVGVLSETDAWSLFSYYAFPVDSKHREIVEDIARKLVKKCDGLPLALQVLGRHMLMKTARSQWNDVYTSKIWDTSFKEKVYNSLAFSYLELQSEAKRCLAFCSVFPKDTLMSKNELIRLWIAQGYLQEREAGKMEDFGEECFDSLVRRSFFQVITRDKMKVLMQWGSLNEFDTYVVMHDIIHDFAQYISNGEVAILDPSFQMPKGSQILRHIALNENESNYPYSSLDRKALRSLFLYKYPKEFLKDFFPNKSYIRALMVRGGSDGLHDGDLKSIGKLKHLRFISLSSSNLTVLPKEICSLPFLQTLDLKMCCEFKSLPKEIGRLICLRHLLFCSNRHIKTLPKGLGNLRSLQTLSYFPCSTLDSKDCSSLEDLGDLNDLRGHLWLKYLDQVAQVNEATKARLHMKKQIRQLTLEFGEGNPSLQSDILEALEPAKENIEFLEISDFTGRRYPRWFSQLRYLKEIRLNCVIMDFLPELGTLLCLEKLCIYKAKEVKRVGAEFFGTCTKEDNVFFQKLTSLKFANMPQWEHWEGPKEISRCCVTIMPLLRHLELSGTGLRYLPRFLEDVPLETLNVKDCHLPPLECNCAEKWRIGDIVVPETLKNIDITWAQSEKEAPVNQPAEASKEVQQPHLKLSSSKMGASLCFVNCSVPRWVTDHLTYLRIIDLSCPKDECLPPFGLIPSLEELTISKAKNVEKVGNEFLGISNNNRGGLGGGGDENKDGSDGGGASTASFAFPRLKKLRFFGMPSWKTWEDPVHKNGDLVIMPKLCDLQLDGCDKLKCLPHFFEAVPLKKLVVYAGSRGSSMPKIRNTTTAENEPAPQMDIRELELNEIGHEWALDWAKYCRGLRELRLYECDAASLVALEMLPSLEILYLDDIVNIRRIGKEVTRISSLKELCLNDMENLEEWEDPSSQLQPSSNEMRELSRNGNNNNNPAAINSTPCLRILSLLSCPKLKALPGFLKSIPLEKLKIACCDALETWWANEAGEDWRNWTSRVPQFKFTGVGAVWKLAEVEEGSTVAIFGLGI